MANQNKVKKLTKEIKNKIESIYINQDIFKQWHDMHIGVLKELIKRIVLELSKHSVFNEIDRISTLTEYTQTQVKSNEIILELQLKLKNHNFIEIVFGSVVQLEPEIKPALIVEQVGYIRCNNNGVRFKFLDHSPQDMKAALEAFLKDNKDKFYRTKN